jgi:DNA-binding IclR family transcriptional regulator
VLLAYAEPAGAEQLLARAAFPAKALAGVRRRGWAASVAEREAGVASVSAPVRATDGQVIAAISVSGPIERLTRTPGRRHAPAVLAAATELSHAIAGSD